MDLLPGRFAAEFYRVRDALGEEPELLANVLAISCTRVLPADGAGISVFVDGLRLPIGASDQLAADAERLQFTTAQGPCLQAHATGVSVRADENMLRQEWPVFHRQLVAHSPYRAVIAIPIPQNGAVWGSVDLFFQRGAELNAVPTELVSTVPVLVGSLLAATAPEVAPVWLDSPVAVPRQTTWIALGMVSGSRGVSPDDALDLIRRHSIRADSTVDRISHELVGRQLMAADLTG